MCVVLLNIKIHSTKEIDGIDALKTQWPQAHILMLSIQDDSEAKLIALSIGLDGVLSKSRAD
jgi:DNA-binding NarL/FixJ family response regulator